MSKIQTALPEIPLNDVLMTAEELAAFLGKTKRFPDLNRKAGVDVIPYIRIDSRTVVYRKSAVLRWLAERETALSVKAYRASESSVFA